MTILIIEDDEAIRWMLTEALTEEGYPVLTAPDGKAALDLLQTQPIRPHLILLDLMLPHMDGWQFLAAQQAHPLLADVPTVLVSAHQHLGATAQTYQFATYLLKPIALQDLYRVVAEHYHEAAPALAREHGQH